MQMMQVPRSCTFCMTRDSIQIDISGPNLYDTLMAQLCTSTMTPCLREKIGIISNTQSRAGSIMTQPRLGVLD